MFAAWVEQPREQASFAYKIFPATDRPGFQRKASQYQFRHRVLVNDNTTSAILDTHEDTVLIVFWAADGELVTVPGLRGYADVAVSSDI